MNMKWNRCLFLGTLGGVLTLGLAFADGPAPRVFEAEAPENTLEGAAVVAEGPGCSGGEKVGYLGNGDGVLRMSLAVPPGGASGLILFYTSGEDRDLVLRVNGGPALTVACPDTGGWDVVGSVSVPLGLSAGPQTLEISNVPGLWCPDLDRVEL